MKLSTIISILNIDTIERILVFAALLLRKLNLVAAVDTAYPYKNSVRIAPSIIRDNNDNILGKLSIEASLFYNSNLFLERGGNLSSAINRYNNLSDYLGNFVCPPTTDNFALITDLPEFITTPEQLFFWATQTLFLSLPPNQKILNLQILEENSLGAIVKITVDLAFDYHEFIYRNNLISALLRVVDSYSFPLNTSAFITADSIFSNHSILDNSFLVGN